MRTPRTRSRSDRPSVTVKQVVLAPAEAVKAMAKGVGVVIKVVTAPFRFAVGANRRRKAKKETKAEALAALRFSRMAPRLQDEVERTRRRLFD